MIENKLVIKLKVDTDQLRLDLSKCTEKMAQLRNLTTDEVNYRKLLQAEINIRNYLKIVK